MIHTIIALEDIFAGERETQGVNGIPSAVNGLRARNFSTNPRDFLDNKFI